MTEPAYIAGDGYMAGPDAQPDTACTPDQSAQELPQQVPELIDAARSHFDQEMALLVEPAEGQTCPLTAQLGEADSLIDACHRKLHAGLSAYLDDVHATCQRCHSACSGCIDVHCDQVEATLAKCYKKIDAKIFQALAQCYNLLAQFGVTIPSDDELQTAQANGGRPTATPAALQSQQSAYPASTNPLDASQTNPSYPPPTLPEPQYGSSQPYEPPTGINLPGYPQPDLPTRVNLPGRPVMPKQPGHCVDVDFCEPIYQWIWYWWLHFWAWWQQQQQDNEQPPPQAEEQYDLWPIEGD